MFWRYDPVLLDGECTVNYHREQFRRLCERLHPYAASVTVSFVDRYAKAGDRGPRSLTREEMLALGESIGRTAAEYALPVQSCCEEVDLAPYGIEKKGCLNREGLEAVCGYTLRLPGERGQRKACLCCASVDIGMYDSCTNSCRYCYANGSAARVLENCTRHRPEGEMLLGEPRPPAEIYKRKADSCRRNQLTFF